MKLCNTKPFAMMRRLALALLAFALILGLPVAGGHWAGLPASVWREFPPRRVVVAHAPFAWAVWIALALVLALVGVCLARRMCQVARACTRAWCAASSQAASGPCAERPGHLDNNRANGKEASMPVWGWVGVVWLLLAWIVAWTRFPIFAPIQRHTYVLLWCGYIVTVSALTQRRAGTCLLTRHPAALAGLAVISAGFWWGFEFLNRGVQNWFYQNLEGFSPAEYAWMATLSFTTVLPAVLGTHNWLETYPRLTAGFEDWLRLRMARPRLTGACCALAGAAGLLLLPVWPNALFPLLWLAPLALLCGLLAAAGEATIFDDLGHGDWRTLLRLSLAAIICGVFWEMWNMYSLARWVYEVPYVGRFKIFEMPLLGYAGYGPFGWECAAVAMVCGLWQPPSNSDQERNA